MRHQGEARVEEVQGHGHAHETETDKADTGHATTLLTVTAWATLTDHGPAAAARVPISCDCRTNRTPGREPLATATQGSIAWESTRSVLLRTGKDGPRGLVHDGVRGEHGWARRAVTGGAAVGVLARPLGTR